MTATETAHPKPDNFPATFPPLITKEPQVLTNDSYDQFASSPKIVAVDTALAAEIPVITNGILLDNGTGTGAMITHAMEQGKLKPPFMVVGNDPDLKALEAARAKFVPFGNNVQFIAAISEALPLRSNSVRAVLHANSSHLAKDLDAAFSESFRVLEPGGEYYMCTGYEKTRSYAEGIEGRAWGLWISLSREYLTERKGYKKEQFQSPVDLRKHTEDEHVEKLKKAGFTDIETKFVEVDMEPDEFVAIGNYIDFAQGALPGVLTEDAREALVKTVPALFKRLNRDHEKDPTKPSVTKSTRRWLFVKAKKPDVAQAA